MLALDTNVLVRRLVHDDDAEQSARVRQALESAFDDGHELYIPLVVLVETV